MNYETLKDWQEDSECTTCKYWDKTKEIGTPGCEYSGIIPKTWWGTCAIREAIRWNETGGEL